jgi:ribosomal-protein-alanine N-acetyltransferase
MRTWDAPPSHDLGETEARVSRSLSANLEWHAAWAILGRAHSQFISMVNYHARQAWNRRLAVGWILVPDCERQSYMREAMRAFLSHRFDSLQTHRVEAEIEPANGCSARLAEGIGFQREGLLRDRLSVAGEPRSCWMYSLLRPEWKRS